MEKFAPWGKEGTDSLDQIMETYRIPKPHLDPDPLHTHPNLKSGEGAEPPRRLCSTRPTRSRPHFLARDTRLCLSFATQHKLRERGGRTRLSEAASQSETATQSEGRKGSYRRMGPPENLTSYWLKTSGPQPVRVGFLARGTGKLRLEFLEAAAVVVA